MNMTAHMYQFIYHLNYPDSKSLQLQRILCIYASALSFACIFNASLPRQLIMTTFGQGLKTVVLIPGITQLTIFSENAGDGISYV